MSSILTAEEALGRLLAALMEQQSQANLDVQDRGNATASINDCPDPSAVNASPNLPSVNKVDASPDAIQPSTDEALIIAQYKTLARTRRTIPPTRTVASFLAKQNSRNSIDTWLRKVQRWKSGRYSGARRRPGQELIDELWPAGSGSGSGVAAGRAAESAADPVRRSPAALSSTERRKAGGFIGPIPDNTDVVFQQEHRKLLAMTSRVGPYLAARHPDLNFPADYWDMKWDTWLAARGGEEP